MNQLREKVLDVDTQYVNCWKDNTRFKWLYRGIDGVESTVDIYRRSTPIDELLQRLRQHDGPPYVVILDEVDPLEDKRQLYDPNRIRDLELTPISNSQRE